MSFNCVVESAVMKCRCKEGAGPTRGRRAQVKCWLVLEDAGNLREFRCTHTHRSKLRPVSGR